MTDDLPLTHEDIAEIAAILENSGYRELDLATRRFRLRVAKGDGEHGGMTQEWQWSGTAADVAPESQAAISDPDAICSPLPGTFYHSPQPGAPPFIQPGDLVGPETVIGIVETMKLMNPVHAGRSGTVGDVLVPDGTLVAKGEALVRLT
ncbi:acetyl-CoA carboxylase biotin carboxyl carrier protein [Novosphingobium taihuense]|uniref:Biotin carboxyl carrier protein of acetyl-CoA carboxylase n=1 Tax=Novosphingobium taihuense TaxID=260085 RepID=A0A7W7EVZ5_9SPHN|nr:biotin/lipoyl-containing protein [Novosphingobium taihuense]MBB4613760.1 biotin carboxyl carrier protein [Novosphingobium taihuense]TWH83269.1 biotin carboxyl carrier protein [Novosphingobium taihuense]